jgi:hypothetical protein
MLALVLAALLGALPQNGTVFTADGGRLRGNVLEAGPSGVSVQLADGSTRKLDAASVKRIDFADGTNWTPTPGQAPAVAATTSAAAAPAAAPAAAGSAAAAPGAAAAPAVAAAAVAPAAAAAAQPSATAPAGKPVAPIAIPLDKLDTVDLAGGGRIRGLVVEATPQEGVVMRLVDGTERRYPTAQVARIEFSDGTVYPRPAKAP